MYPYSTTRQMSPWNFYGQPNQASPGPSTRQNNQSFLTMSPQSMMAPVNPVMPISPNQSMTRYPMTANAPAIPAAPKPMPNEAEGLMQYMADKPKWYGPSMDVQPRMQTPGNQPPQPLPPVANVARPVGQLGQFQPMQLPFPKIENDALAQAAGNMNRINPFLQQMGMRLDQNLPIPEFNRRQNAMMQNQMRTWGGPGGLLAAMNQGGGFIGGMDQRQMQRQIADRLGRVQLGMQANNLAEGGRQFDIGANQWNQNFAEGGRQFDLGRQDLAAIRAEDARRFNEGLKFKETPGQQRSAGVVTSMIPYMLQHANPEELPSIVRAAQSGNADELATVAQGIQQRSQTEKATAVPKFSPDGKLLDQETRGRAFLDLTDRLGITDPAELRQLALQNEIDFSSLAGLGDSNYMGIAKEVVDPRNWPGIYQAIAKGDNTKMRGSLSRAINQPLRAIAAARGQ